MALFTPGAPSPTGPDLPNAPSLDSPPPSLYASDLSEVSGPSGAPSGAIPKLIGELETGLRLLARILPRDRASGINEILMRLRDLTRGTPQGGPNGNSAPAAQVGTGPY